MVSVNWQMCDGQWYTHQQLNTKSALITLFRRIREKLIGEGNTRRYLIYAVGEILLVMIGILLALQVNNWNEERKTNAEMVL